MCTHAQPRGQATRVQVEALTAQQLQVRQTPHTRTHTHSYQRTNTHAGNEPKEQKLHTNAARAAARQGTHTHYHTHSMSEMCTAGPDPLAWHTHTSSGAHTIRAHTGAIKAILNAAHDALCDPDSRRSAAKPSGERGLCSCVCVHH